MEEEEKNSVLEFRGTVYLVKPKLVLEPTLKPNQFNIIGQG